MFRFSAHPPHRPNFIKLTTTMAVLAVVATTVLPVVNDHAKRGHRANARAALSNAAQWMERLASAHGRYPTAAAIPEGVLFVKGGQYTIAVASPDGLSYTLTAHPQGAQASDRCGSYRIDHAGVRNQVATAKVPYPLGPQECWKQ